MWLTITPEIMEIEERSHFYDEVDKFIRSFNKLYRIKHVVDNQVQVIKGYQI